MEYSISINFKYFSLKMNMGKYIFPWEKQNFESTGKSTHTTEYLAFGKTLLVRLYLKVKVYITNLLSVYNSQKILRFK